MKSWKWLNCAGIGACVLGLSACASQRPSGTYRTGIEREALVTVEAIDVPSRLVTVRTASGDPLTVYVAESNKHFPQADVGDQVRVRFVESVALRLAQPGSAAAGISVKEKTSRPQAGKPTASTGTEVTAIVKIEYVEPGGYSVKFTGPRGRRTVQVHDPSMRDYVKKLRAGDEVEVTYEEALALSLERASRG